MSKESLDEYGFTLAGNDERSGKRRAYRIALPGITLTIGESPFQFSISDISATGISFAGEYPVMRAGQDIYCNIWIAGQLYLAGLQAVVVRAEQGKYAATFHQMDRRQEIRLDKFILETQKRIIAHRKSMQTKVDKQQQCEPGEGCDPAEISLKL